MNNYPLKTYAINFLNFLLLHFFSNLTFKKEYPNFNDPTSEKEKKEACTKERPFHSLLHVSDAQDLLKSNLSSCMSRQRHTLVRYILLYAALARYAGIEADA